MTREIVGRRFILIWKHLANQIYLQNMIFVGFRQVLQTHLYFSQEPKFNKKTTVK